MCKLVGWLVGLRLAIKFKQDFISALGTNKSAQQNLLFNIYDH